jgi:hypothetical protein
MARRDPRCECGFASSLCQRGARVGKGSIGKQATIGRTSTVFPVSQRVEEIARARCARQVTRCNVARVMSTLPRLPRGLVRALASLALVLVSLTLATSALAAGNFTIKTAEVTEANGLWHIKVRIDMPKAPGMMHIPMRFTFSKEVVDERAIMSKGADPVHHRQVLDVPPRNIQSLDVDFADTNGKVFKSTYFEFDLARATGFFEAGEYLVSLSGPDSDIGVAQKLILHGDNPPVYRGAMDFTSSGPVKKTGPNIQAVGTGIDGGPGGGSGDDSGTAAAGVSNGDVAAVGSGGDMVPGSAFGKTPEEEAVQGHPKGCGCVAAGMATGSLVGFGGASAVVGMGLLFSRRRRSRAPRA